MTLIVARLGVDLLDLQGRLCYGPPPVGQGRLPGSRYSRYTMAALSLLNWVFSPPLGAVNPHCCGAHILMSRLREQATWTKRADARPSKGLPSVRCVPDLCDDNACLLLCCYTLYVHTRARAHTHSALSLKSLIFCLAIHFSSWTY